MSVTSNFGFTNTTSATKSAVKPSKLQVLSNYGKIEDESDKVSYSNKTCLGQREVITYGAKPLKTLNLSPSMKWSNKPKTTTASQYEFKIEDILRTTDETGAIIEDAGICAYLIVKHSDSPYITAEHLETVVNRLMGTIQADDGTTRYADMMAGALAVSHE